MAQVARAVENTAGSTVVPGSSACGGALWVHNWTKQRQRYYDSEWKYKVDNLIPPLMMPYRHTLTEEFAILAPRPTGSAQVHFKHCYGGHSTGSYSTNQAILRAQNSAASDLLTKIGDLDTFDLGMALAEGRETIGLVANSATRIAKAFRSLKHGNIKKTFEWLGLTDNVKLHPNRYGPNGVPLKYSGDHRRYLQRSYRRRDASGFAARSWLELTYGWKPLLYTIDGAAEKLATMLQNNHSDVTVRGKAEEKGSYAFSDANVSHQGTFSAKCSWVVELKVINDALRLKTSLGLTNPASIAWELVPFSFVVDWFIPIGGWINSLSVLNGYSIVKKSRTTRVSHVGLSETLLTNSFVKKGFQAKLSYTYNDCQRVNNLTPTLRSPFFDMGAKLGASRLTSALSLLKVVFGK